jgi:hypothetical protein
MAAWLTAADAVALVEASAAASDAAWVGAVDASAAYVEEKRPDLFAGTPPVFTPGAQVRLGTAMLAHRWYARRVQPLGGSQAVEFGPTDFIRQDPDIAKLLGIGAEGRFVFGAALPAPTVVTP